MRRTVENELVEEKLHWADEKEVIKSNKSLLFLLYLIKLFPKRLVLLLIYPVGFFYFIFSKRARIECENFQKTLKEFTKGKVPKRINAYPQIVSFSLCVTEKMEGWLGNYHYDKLVLHDDDLGALKSQLEEGKGAVLLCSHLGNIELLRSLSSFGENGVSRNISVTTIMEVKSTEVFNRTLKEINSEVALNVIDPSDIGPDTIEKLQNEIESGGLVVIAGDRTSARSRSRFIRESFLGKEADFPYGVFLIAFLLKAPVYYCFGLRTKYATTNPYYNMFVEKSVVELECGRSEREKRIKDLCHEFVEKLEKYTVKYPEQWYNFYNFWLLNEDCKS